MISRAAPYCAVDWDDKIERRRGDNAHMDNFFSVQLHTRKKLMDATSYLAYKEIVLDSYARSAGVLMSLCSLFRPPKACVLSCEVP